MKTLSSAAAALIVFGVAAFPVAAQTETKTQEKKPSAGEVIERYLEVIGGREAAAKLKNRVAIFELEFVGQGLKLKADVSAARPNKSYLKAEIEGLGGMQEGCDGKEAWSMSDIGGNTVSEGTERDDKLLGAAFDKYADWKKLFKEAEHKGVVKTDGKACHKLVMTPKAGSVQTWFFDAESGLMVREDAVQRQMGSEFPTVSRVSDYRKVDGVLMPHKIVTEIGTLAKQAITVKDIKHNVEMPEGRFDLPDEVKKIIEKRKAEDKAKGKDEKGASKKPL